MKAFHLIFAVSLILASSILSSAQAGTPHVYRVASPDHEQTFSYGTETRRVWTERNGHLALLLDFTNDPYVDRQNPRLYDNFTFAFPSVRIGQDKRTFYYRSIPVARRQADFLGVNEIHLLPNVELILHKPHGYISLTLEIADSVRTASDQ